MHERYTLGLRARIGVLNWSVVTAAAATFGLVCATVSLAVDESIGTSLAVGLSGAVLIGLGGVILRGELRTFWPQTLGTAR